MPDWTLLQSFLAVCETGSLSAAARKTGQSQPTLGRHMKTLEDQLGLTLFRRVPAGLEPTVQAAQLIEPARAMAAGAARLSRLAEGQQDGIAGTVRITASTIMSHYLLPPVIARLRLAEPLIQIELVPSDATENLLFREADIALRMYRPEQLDIVTRHLDDLPTGIYAARSYLDRVGRPQTIEEVMKLDFLGFDRSDLVLRSMRAMGFDVDREFFALRCDDQPVYWELLRAGCGIGGAQCQIADADPLIERVLPEVDLPALPLWIAAPQALRTSPRMRRVWDELVAAFGTA